MGSDRRDEQPGQRLIFGYNAEEGLLPTIMDSLRKLFAPKTYDCPLCAVTHTPLGQRREWKDYIRRLPYEVRFYHRDGCHRDWPQMRIELPAILLQRPDQPPAVLLGASELSEQKSAAQLIAVLGRVLARPPS